MNFLKSTYFGALAVALTLVSALQVALLSIVYSLLRKEFPTNLGHRVGIQWGRSIMACMPGWHVDLIGKSNIPKDKPFILVANHESTADIFSIFLLGIQFRWIAKYELFQVPILGYCMRKIGYIPVKRGDKHAHRSALLACKKWIEKGVPVLFFPEGTRSEDGKPKKFKVGAFKLSMECDVPILPVVLSGAGKLMQKGSICPNSATLKIKVLQTVHPRKDEDVDAFALRVQELVVKEHSKLSKG